MSFGGSASEIKLPNRRTARDAAPRVHDEVSAIRAELAEMQNELARELETEQAQGNLEDEVTQLYHELQRATGKLDHEKALRKRAEAELEALRTHRLRESTDAVQELEKKRGELATLREERAMMKEWLDRGVAECKRVADEVSRLKGELETTEKSCAGMSKEKQRLALTIQQLSDELNAAQLALDKVQHEKSVLELRCEEANATLLRSEELRRSAAADADRMSSDVVRLSQRVRGLEDAEVSMQSMCACTEQLCREIGVLDGAILSGNIDEAVASVGRVPVAEAAHNIAEPKPLSVMVIDAKRLLQLLQDSLGRLRGSVRRFLSEKQKAHAEAQRRQQMEVEEVHRQREAALLAYRDECEGLQRRVRDLECEILNVAEGVHRDVSHEASERLAALDRLSSQNRELAGLVEALRADNDRLRVKAKKMKIDWNKVDESRRRFQQLQIEVSLMKEHNDKLSAENRNLKVMMDARSGQAGDGGALRGAFGSPSAVPAEQLLSVHKHAFEEWRNAALRSSALH